MCNIKSYFIAPTPRERLAMVVVSMLCIIGTLIALSFRAYAEVALLGFFALLAAVVAILGLPKVFAD